MTKKKNPIAQLYGGKVARWAEATFHRQSRDEHRLMRNEVGRPRESLTMEAARSYPKPPVTPTEKKTIPMPNPDDPVATGMHVFQLEEPLWNHKDTQKQHLLNCAEAAIRTAVFAERMRCQKICAQMQDEIAESGDDSAYTRAYKDAAEDCSLAIGEIQGIEAAYLDAALAAIEEDKAHINDKKSGAEMREPASKLKDLVDELSDEQMPAFKMDRTEDDEEPDWKPEDLDDYQSESEEAFDDD